MTERLQKILAARGIGSRRYAEALIAAGRVTCNGQVCTLGQSADPERDEILLDGKPLPSRGKNIYILLHKPRGFVTTMRDEKGRRNAYELVADCSERVYPVGRLDMDSEGLLLFTNDGDFANRMMHPSHNVDKVYKVWVKGCSEDGIARLGRPMTLDGYRLRIPKVTLLHRAGEQAELEITIHEGRNRQVRRMCAIAGMKVYRLQRIAEGSLRLGDLPAGKWRYLTAEELAELQK